MVASSRFGTARGGPRGQFALQAPSWPLVLARAGHWPVLTALYLLATLALLVPGLFGAPPQWAHNWEGYTAWRWATYWEPPAGPAVEIWAPTDGLMTDSGQGPLVGFPVALGMALGGGGIDAMRVPVALLAATSVPLLWLYGRRIFGPGPAMLAALLLATSPVFLLYGRTATLVGVSLAPVLLTAIALARVLDAPRGTGWQWRREGLLAGSLLLGIYAYAPVRLLWPLAVGSLGIFALRDPARRGVLLRAALLCALAVPVATMVLEQLAAPQPDPQDAVLGYFHARGEHVVAMSADPGQAGEYLRDAPRPSSSGIEQLRLLVSQNVADLARLLADRDTAPVATEYWNASGRLWPWLLFPFAVIGAIPAASGAWQNERRILLLPLVLAAGLALPLVLTSRVHVGRLLPALPFLLLLAAAGAWTLAGWLADRARAGGAGDAARWIAPLLAGALLLPAAALARTDLGTPPAPTREALTAAALAGWHEEVRERGGAVLVEDPALGDDIERVHAATYRLDLARLYRFVDMQRAQEIGFDSRPPLLWHGTLGALKAGVLSRPCVRLWFVAPEIAAEFFSAWRLAGCTGAPDTYILP